MKRFLISLGIFILLIIIALLVANTVLKSKLEKALTSDLPPELEIEYSDINVSTWQGNVAIADLKLKSYSKNNKTPHTTLQIEKLEVIDLHYWDYLFNNTIHLDKIKIDGNSIEHRSYEQKPDSITQKKRKSLNKKIVVDAFEVTPTQIKVLKKSAPDSLWLSVKNFMVNLKNIQADSTTIHTKVPFTYEKVTLKTDSVFLSLNPYDNFTIEELDLKNNQLNLLQAAIKTQYTRSQLTQRISRERDHIDLTIPHINLNKFDWNITQDTISINAPSFLLTNPKLNIYRNKLVADDNRMKPMYSEMLRNLPFRLRIDSTSIKNAYIKYSEKVKTEEPPGNIEFLNMNAHIKNLANTYKSKDESTLISVDAQFMNSSPMHVDWSFDVTNLNDQFRFKGEVANLPASNMNSFTEPNLRVKLTGELKKAYFDISGNKNDSRINMRMDYDDFKLNVLNEKSKKKWLTSAIANIFVSKDSDKEGEGDFRKGSNTAQRDKSKSVFNFLWLSIKSGLIDTMTGDREYD